MTNGKRMLTTLALAAAALLTTGAVLAGASWTLFRAMMDRARSDLEARAELAAAVLEEPLRTQDFRRIRAFGDECRARGVQFSVESANGGSIYWNMQSAPEKGKWDWTECGPSLRRETGDFRIVLGLNGDMLVLYGGALALAGVAFLVGIVAMLGFFFAFYRQRMKLAAMARLQKERYDFVTEFTHELKTPLTGIIAAADMLEGNELARMIKSSAHRLDQLAQDLIDVYWGRKNADR